MLKDNVIFIGKKPVMTYVTSTAILAKKYDEIVLKARGNSIQKACDASQIAIRKMLDNYKISDIQVGTEEMDKSDDKGVRKINVSTIEIKLVKQ